MKAQRPARMKRYQVDESLAAPGELRKLVCMLNVVVHATEHHVFEVHPPVKASSSLDYVCQRILHVDRHERTAKLVGWCVDGNRQPELLRTLAQCNDAR